MNIFKDIKASLTDIVGGNSDTYENTLDSINNEVINKLKQKADSIGANSILNLRVENNEISSSGKSMLMVTAVGTAVICDFISNERKKEQKIETYQRNSAEYSKAIIEEEQNQKTKELEALMEKYNINYKDEHYYLGDYKYSKLEDAVNYAKVLEGKK